MLLMTKLYITNNQISKIVLGYFLIAFFLACKGQPSDKKVRSIRLYSKIDLFEPANKNYFTLIDSVNLYFYKDMAMCQIFNIHELIDERNVKVKPVRLQRIRESFFIYRNGDSIGAVFGSLEKPDYFPYLVKAFLAKKAVISFSNYYNKNNDSLVRSYTERD